MPQSLIGIENLKKINMDFLKEYWKFLMERKKWWLIPAVIVILLLTLLIVFGTSTATAPFVYTLF